MPNIEIKHNFTKILFIPLGPGAGMLLSSAVCIIFKFRLFLFNFRTRIC